MATIQKKEIEKHLQIALEEVGEIKPWYDKEVDCWVFEHPNYPVSCGEDTPEAVIAKYPLYLREFILHRLADRLDPLVEKATKGRGGARPGAGRPKKEQKTLTKTIRLPTDLYGAALWLRQHPEALPEIKKIMKKYA
jgi:hypothetical protein